jgi:effector-binding domain-containing protein
VGRVQQSNLAGATVARTVYRGGYEGLGEAWAEFNRWVEGAGHDAAPELWECYTKGPESSAEPGKWETELYRPLAASPTS